MYILYSPERSLKYAICRPSGDHVGQISADPLEFVMLRTSPFSAGMVKISPRASTAARRPVGDSARFVMLRPTSFHCGIIHAKSPLAVMFTTAVRPVLGSSVCTLPACSKTTVLPPASSDFTSKSVNFVCCLSALDFVSHDHTF